MNRNKQSSVVESDRLENRNRRQLDCVIACKLFAGPRDLSDIRYCSVSRCKYGWSAMNDNGGSKVPEKRIIRRAQRAWDIDRSGKSSSLINNPWFFRLPLVVVGIDLPISLRRRDGCRMLNARPLFRSARSPLLIHSSQAHRKRRNKVTNETQIQQGMRSAPNGALPNVSNSDGLQFIVCHTI